MLVLAVTLHNIPEGMAVGAVFAGMAADDETITLMGALALAIGIAIQNIPEGAIISMPVCSAGNSKNKAFCMDSFGSGRACGSIAYHMAGRIYPAVSALSSCICSRSNALCSGGRTDPGDFQGRALQCRNH